MSAKAKPCEFLSLSASYRGVILHEDGSSYISDLGQVTRPDSVDADLLRAHLSAFFTQSIDGIPGDNTADRVLNDIYVRAENNDPVRAVSLAEQEAYLQIWGSRL